MSLDGATAARIQSFADTLDAQAERYRSILALGEAQAAALAEHDLAAFTDLLGRKAGLMAEIAGLDADAMSHRAVWEAHRDEVEEPLRGRLRGVVEELRGLLERLLTMERACEVQLATTKADVARELNVLGQGKQALRSYQPPPADAPRRRLDLGG